MIDQGCKLQRLDRGAQPHLAHPERSRIGVPTSKTVAQGHSGIDLLTKHDEALPTPALPSGRQRGFNTAFLPKA